MKAIGVQFLPLAGSPLLLWPWASWYFVYCCALMLLSTSCHQSPVACWCGRDAAEKRKHLSSSFTQTHSRRGQLEVGFAQQLEICVALILGAVSFWRESLFCYLLKGTESTITSSTAHSWLLKCRHTWLVWFFFFYSSNCLLMFSNACLRKFHLEKC